MKGIEARSVKRSSPRLFSGFPEHPAIVKRMLAPVETQWFYLERKKRGQSPGRRTVVTLKGADGWRHGLKPWSHSPARLREEKGGEEEDSNDDGDAMMMVLLLMTTTPHLLEL